jgi:PAS domain S-box-containing protein
MVFKKPSSPLTVRSEEQAIRWFTFTHAIGLLLFVGLMGAFFWYLHISEQEQQRQSLFRDVEWAQQNIRLRLSDAKDLAAQYSPEWASYSVTETMSAEPQRNNGIRAFLNQFSEVTYVSMVDGNRKIVWHLPARSDSSSNAQQAGAELEGSAGFTAYTEARESRKVVFSYPISTQSNEVVIEMHIPDLSSNSAKSRTSLIVGFSLSRLITQAVSSEIRSRYEISLLDQGGNRLISTSPRTIFAENFSYDLPLDPPGHGIRLRATLFEGGSQLLNNRLVYALIGMSLAVALGMMLVWQHTRRRLRAENERDRLFMLSLDLLCVIAEDGALLKINPAFSSEFPSATTVTRLPELVHPADRSFTDNALSGTNDSAIFEARTNRDLPLSMQEAGTRWFSWSMRRDSRSNPPQWYCVAHDITKRKQAETALAAEIAFRKAMEDSMVTGMRAFDLEGRVTYVNRAFCSMVGLEESELIGRTAPFPYWPTNDIPGHAKNLELILSGAAPASGLEVTVQRKDGTYFDARMYVSPLIDASGHQSGWMTSMTDITEPKRVRQALTDAQDRFTTVLDELEPAVSVLDAKGELLFSNQAYQRIFGNSSQGQERLRSAREVETEVDRDVKAELITQSNPANSSIEIFDQATSRWFDVRLRPIRWVDQSEVTMMMATDITRRHHAEQTQREQGEKLQHTSRLVTMGEMASSLAHELNQPLSAIANYCMGLAARIRSKTLSGSPIDSEETLDALKKTSGQAERAGLVIKRIREFVKRSEPERRQCLITDVVSNALTLVEIEAKRLNIRIDTSMPHPTASVWADPILIEQVLINLVKNAIESMRTSTNKTKSKLYLKVQCVDDNAKFEVRDFGSGVPDNIETKLFQPFFSTKVEGMGMGLNICRSIVEAHQGRLYLERHSDGTSFIFTLPLAASFSSLVSNDNKQPQETPEQIL